MGLRKNRLWTLLMVALVGALFLADPAAAAAPAVKTKQLVIGHRGAAGYRPEHTLASYDLAIEMGADYVEPDLVSTKDGVLVARHENDISATTDVAKHPEFANRKTTKIVDGVKVTGWFTEDFTLAELKTLRAVERIPDIRPRNTLYNGRYQVPTLQEIINLVEREGKRLHRTIGIYPETKHPTYFRDIGLPLEERLASVLRRNGLASKNSAVFVQSFEPQSLQRMNELVGDKLIQLVDATGSPVGSTKTFHDLVTPAGLAWVKRYADGVGVNTALIYPPDAAGNVSKPTTVVADAHKAGLLVHAWTLRDENTFLPANFRQGADPSAYGDAFGWFELILSQGVDGIFSDNADTARAAVNAGRTAA
jgi:glycerophosphoryl diester phosphodiesterase